MALPGPSVLRVWDCLFVDGHVVLFRVALALLKAIEGELGLATQPRCSRDALAVAKRESDAAVLAGTGDGGCDDGLAAREDARDPNCPPDRQR
eukprot:1089864-Rhodomonas_salina.2